MTAQDWERLALVGATGFVLSLILVPVAGRAAVRLGIMDRPAKGKLHVAPTPYLGGVAVLIAVLGATAIRGWQGQVWAILGGAFLVSCIGLLDDVRTANPILRILIEAGAAAIVFSAGARFQMFGEIPDALITIVWLVGLTNAYNLLDNMDACASLIIAVSASALLAAAVFEGQVLPATLATAIIAASLGFLVYNWHPARIFLGDAGSLFLGFILSATALKLRFPVGHTANATALVLIASPALFDTLLVVVSRLISRRPIYVGGTDHTAHRLAILGLTNRQIAGLLACVSGACGALGVAVGQGAVSPWIVVSPLAILAVVLITQLLRVSVYSCLPSKVVERHSSALSMQRNIRSAVDA